MAIDILRGYSPVTIEPVRIDGVKYRAEDLGKVYELTWTCSDRDKWAKVLNFVRSIPGRTFNRDSKLWQVPNTPVVYELLNRSGWFEAPVEQPKVEKPKRDAKQSLEKNKYRVPRQFRDAYLNDEVVPEYNPEERQRNAIANNVLDADRVLIPGLREYQVDFLKFADIRGGRVVLGDSMGTGKTLSSIAWIAYSNSFPALIVVNASTKLQWRQEYRKWLSKVKGLPTRSIVIKGKKPYDIEDGVTAIINWDILDAWVPVLLRKGYKCLVGDEAQAIGNPKSKRAKAFLRLAESIPEVITMSGTPARSRPAQFWTMLHIADPNLFPSYDAFLYRYCEPKWTPFSCLPTFNGAMRTKELHAMLMKVMLRRTKDQVMKFLPAKTIQVVPLEVDDAEMRKYKEEEFCLQSADSVDNIRAHIAGLLHSAYMLKEKSLVNWVADFLDSGNKLLLFAWHRDVVDVLADKLKDYRPAKIYGGLTANKREDEKNRFITDPCCRVCIANIQAGGVGIDGFQQVCCDVAFAEFSHTPTDHRQAEDRLHRGGQDKPVTSYYLVAPDTIDEEAVEILDERAKMLDGILDGKEACDIDLLSEILARHGVSV